MSLSKKHYAALVQLVHDFDKGVAEMEFGKTDWSHQTSREDLHELLVARLAWFCAQDNPNFDSFKVTDAVKKGVL